MRLYATQMRVLHVNCAHYHCLEEKLRNLVLDMWIKGVKLFNSYSGDGNLFAYGGHMRINWMLVQFASHSKSPNIKFNKSVIFQFKLKSTVGD